MDKIGIRTLALVACLISAAQAAAQELTMTELLKGNRVRLSMMPNAIPSGYSAVRIRAGDGGFGEMFGGSMGMIGMMMGGMSGNDASEMGMLAALDVSWSNGQVVSLHGQPFLVTYKIDLDMSDMMKMQSRPDLSTMPLRLSLVKLDSIKTISTKPDITRQSFAAMLKPKPKPPTGATPAKKP